MAYIRWGEYQLSMTADGGVEFLGGKADPSSFFMQAYGLNGSVIHVQNPLTYITEFDITLDSSISPMVNITWDSLAIESWVISKYGEEKNNILKNEFNTFRDSQAWSQLCFYGGFTYSGSISSASGFVSPNGSGFGTQCAVPMNKNCGQKNYYSNSGAGPLDNAYYYWFFNFLKFVGDNEVFSFSDVVQDMIDENSVVVPSDTSFHFDVYINHFKESALMGGYKTESVLVRWTCPAVNIGTEEYIAQNPDYEYRANNTTIQFRVSKAESSASQTRISTNLYGDLEKKFTMSALCEAAGVSNFMETISNIIPSTRTGDVRLYLQGIFENLSVSDTCYVDIPLNSTTNDPSHINVVNGRLGSTITVHYGDPVAGVDPSVVGWNEDARRDITGDDSQHRDTDSSNVTGSESGAFNSNIGLLTKTYAMTEAMCQSMGNYLWSPDFRNSIQMINNSPIENIISVKAFPFPISGGASATVTLGNVVLSGISGNVIPSSFVPKKTIGTFKVSKKFSGHLDWLNYGPFSKLTIFCPYAGGFHELDINKYIDKTITVKYIYDVICGTCTVGLYYDGLELDKFSGTMAIDIPISASNRAQVETSHVLGGLSAISQLLTGNIFGAAAFGLNALTAQYHTNTSGSPSPSCDGFDEQNCYIIVDTPVYYEPSTFKHDFGYPCNLSLTLGNCRGFTKCHNVCVDELACTEMERAEIKKLLERGVYL